jgi:hypothetical protein
MLSAADWAGTNPSNLSFALVPNACCRFNVLAQLTLAWCSL